MSNMNRRDFVRGVSLLPLCALAEAAPAKRKEAAVLKISLNAYSFHKLLNDAISGRSGGITLIHLLEFAAKNKFDGLDATGYYFLGYPAVPDNAYVDALKGRADDLGIGISGTGVRNNFTTADKSVRDAGVKHIKEWVEVAASLGAPVLRVFADTQGQGQTWETVSGGASRDQVEAWIAADLKQCADQGKKFGVRIGVQNHGDFLKTGPQLLKLVKEVGSDWCAPILDTGSFKTPDPYADMAMVAPTAINWQIKTSVFGADSDIPIDLHRLMTIVRKSGYSGYLPIETLSPKGKPYDPYTLVPEFLKQVRQALEQTA
jgi:sugar phosphate isomerase/epimerase